MDDKQRSLDELIFVLSKTETKISSDNILAYVEKIQQIYDGDFRHYYSKVFGTLTMIKNDSQYDLQNLTDNIRTIFEKIEHRHREKDCEEEFYLKAKKLYDHINLDVARINYTEELVNRLNAQNSKLRDDLLKISQKAERMQRDYVTILGIFAAIILAFVSGITFSTSALNNIDKVSIYHLVFVILLIAALVFNLVNLLLCFLREINYVDLTGNDNVFLRNVNWSISGALLIDTICWCVSLHCFK